MSHLFQRPLCQLGEAFDYSFRPLIGPADEGTGGPCDDRPHRVELFAAGTDPSSPLAEWRPFSLCPDHEGQLDSYDARLRTRGLLSRFRRSPARPGG